MHFTATASERLSLASLTVLGAVRGPETRSIPKLFSFSLHYENLLGNWSENTSQTNQLSENRILEKHKVASVNTAT